VEKKPEKTPKLSKQEELKLLKEKIEKEAAENFNQFISFLESNTSDCILMIKEWINQYTEYDQLALKAVAQQLASEKLAKIFAELNPMEREKWKSSLVSFLEGKDLVKANRHITEEVARSKISPHFVKDVELVDLLMRLSVEVASQFVVDHEDSAKILLNLVNANFSAKILDSMDEEKALALIEESLTFDFADVKDSFKGFKDILAKYIEEKRKKPFNFQLLKILPTFNPVKEKMIYDQLASQGLFEEMKDLAVNNFPSDLILNLPSEFLKVVMQNYTMNKKVELLASLEEQKKNQLMESFAAEGSASREMLDLEFENINNDPSMQSRIQNQKDEIWKDFVFYIREQIAQDEEFSSEFEMLISAWIDDIKAASGADLNMAS
jgi:Mg/Co/Ni transporter MgtE